MGRKMSDLVRGSLRNGSRDLSMAPFNAERLAMLPLMMYTETELKLCGLEYRIKRLADEQREAA